MTRSRIFATTAAVCLVASGAAEAQQVGKPIKTIGQWSIEHVTENGKFFGCRANTKTPTGIVGVLQYANGSWVVTLPDMNFPDGQKLSGVLEMNRASEPFTLTVSRKGLREAIKINAGILDALRQGGNLMANVGGKTFSWRMDNGASAIGAVQDCRNLGAAGGGPSASPAPGGAKEVYTPWRDVGPWKISTVTVGPKFNRCRAGLKTRDGELSLIQWENGKWSIGIPNLGWPTGKKFDGMLEFNRASVPFKITTTAGLRPTITIDDGMLSALRDGGFLQVNVGGQSRSWRLDQTASAMGGVQDCRREGVNR